MTHPTLDAFGHPETCIAEYEHWVVLLRMQQITLGSLVVAAKSDATHLGGLTPAEWSEFGRVMDDVERVVREAFGCRKLNALALMMRDPNVHFHVVPRYDASRRFAGTEFTDEAWPGPPDVRNATPIGDTAIGVTLLDHLRGAWPTT